MCGKICACLTILTCRKYLLYLQKRNLITLIPLIFKENTLKNKNLAHALFMGNTKENILKS